MNKFKNYFKAYKIYNEAFTKKSEELDNLAKDFGEKHRIGVTIHYLCILIAVYSVTIGIGYGIYKVIDYFYWKHEEKLAKEAGEKAHENEFDV